MCLISNKIAVMIKLLHIDLIILLTSLFFFEMIITFTLLMCQIMQFLTSQMLKYTIFQNF